MNHVLKNQQVISLNKWSEGFQEKVYSRRLLHNVLNGSVLIGCLIIWFRIVFVLGPVAQGSIYFLSAILAGVMTYSLMLFSYHEGLNHNLIFLGNSKGIEMLRYISSNLYKFAFVLPALVIFKHAELHTIYERVLFCAILFLVCFVLNALRKYVEYNLLPGGESSHRSLGTGFWATLVGGGPWGQSCSLIQKLCPHLPWYGRIMGHYKLSELLDSEQKRALMPLEKRNFLFVLVEIYLTNLNYSQRMHK